MYCEQIKTLTELLKNIATIQKSVEWISYYLLKNIATIQKSVEWINYYLLKNIATIQKSVEWISYYLLKNIATIQKSVEWICYYLLKNIATIQKSEMKMKFLGRTCLIVLSLLPAVSTQIGWTVVGTDQPVIAEPGDDVILPCHISPRLSAVDMEVRWFREKFDRPVHLYMNQNNLLETQDSDYQGRTALSPEALQTGDISLKLRNLQPSDSGIYTCYADDRSWYEDGQTEVIVAAMERKLEPMGK
ncbi:myelin-oligodendrocyte glycoprotein-like [Acipenser oxyrinchus oxyrinchus]|uniref:Myelin-oligodendrocyte glycoprotein-like n=1 Tax=Acipenser oxyrinchus oxyrinchus TaxID=40147 RepID=A0AAD8CNP7_ACIOX|nr:myelin-oligodendrocyte glycoprotein-like [Acipenser oxyrinchus oxyrinchus]